MCVGRVLFYEYVYNLFLELAGITEYKSAFLKFIPQKYDSRAVDRDLSLGSSAVRASHRSPEVCEFNPNLEPRNHIPEE